MNRNSGARTQSFGYDALGNWTSVTTNGSTQTRSANMQNEYTSVSGASTPTYDANGNMLSDETGKQSVYDAWNRLKVVKNSGRTTLVTYHYDARNYRIAEVVGSDTRSLYYSSQWQVLEERVNGTARVSNVWSAVYVDALIARDRDADSNGSLEERLYVTHDANFNTTALLNTSGAVVEKYAYDPYGAVTVYNASNTVLGSSAYAMQYLHQGGRLSAESGLYYFRNRDYSTTVGRWVSLDPIRFSAGDVNLYRYVGNNPGNGLDPSGLAGPVAGLIRLPARPAAPVGTAGPGAGIGGAILPAIGVAIATIVTMPIWKPIVSGGQGNIQIGVAVIIVESKPTIDTATSIVGSTVNIGAAIAVGELLPWLPKPKPRPRPPQNQQQVCCIYAREGKKGRFHFTAPKGPCPPTINDEDEGHFILYDTVQGKCIKEGYTE